MRRFLVLTLTLGVALAAPISSDVLETRDGRLLEGTYLGGTQRALRFEAENGIEVFLTEEVLALTFTGSASRAAQGPPQATARQPASSSTSVDESTWRHRLPTHARDVDYRLSFTHKIAKTCFTGRANSFDNPLESIEMP